MGTQMTNYGRNTTVRIYVEDVRVTRDFMQQTKANTEAEYSEGKTGYLGRAPVTAWQIYEITKFSFTLEESSESYISSVLDNIDRQALANTKTKVTVAFVTNNADGTTSTKRLLNCTIKGGRDIGAKLEKNTWSFSGMGTDEDKVK